MKKHNKLRTNKKVVSSIIVLLLIVGTYFVSGQDGVNELLGIEKAGTVQTVESLDPLPKYQGQPYAVVNDNVPFFTEKDMLTLSASGYEQYGALDDLGRATYAEACVGRETMPLEGEERGSIGMVKPSGWHTVKYDCVDGKYLFNRCHLAAYMLTNENANELNLITGTRSFNVDGMLPFEDMVAEYIKDTENHVAYRVTPIYDGENLLASGALMEAMSIEDKGKGIEFCVYVFNVQDGIEIDYATGESKIAQ